MPKKKQPNNLLLNALQPYIGKRVDNYADPSKLVVSRTKELIRLEAAEAVCDGLQYAEALHELREDLGLETHEVSDAVHFLASKKPGAWGIVLVVRTGPAADLVLQSPHTGGDNADRLSTELFMRCDARVLILSAVHEHSAPARAGEKHKSDGAHDVDTLFAEACDALHRIYPTAFVAQIHGQDDPTGTSKMYLTNQFGPQFTDKYRSAPGCLAHALTEVFPLKVCNNFRLGTQTLPPLKAGDPATKDGLPFTMRDFRNKKCWFRNEEKKVMNTNVQGRQINGGGQWSRGTEDKGCFVHVEAAPWLRDADRDFQRNMFCKAFSLAVAMYAASPLPRPAFDFPETLDEKCPEFAADGDIVDGACTCAAPLEPETETETATTVPDLATGPRAPPRPAPRHRGLVEEHAQLPLDMPGIPVVSTAMLEQLFDTAQAQARLAEEHAHLAHEADRAAKYHAETAKAHLDYVLRRHESRRSGTPALAPSFCDNTAERLRVAEFHASVLMDEHAGDDSGAKQEFERLAVVKLQLALARRDALFLESAPRVGDVLPVPESSTRAAPPPVRKPSAAPAAPAPILVAAAPGRPVPTQKPFAPPRDRATAILQDLCRPAPFPNLLVALENLLPRRDPNYRNPTADEARDACLLANAAGAENYWEIKRMMAKCRVSAWTFPAERGMQNCILFTPVDEKAFPVRFAVRLGAVVRPHTPETYANKVDSLVLEIPHEGIDGTSRAAAELFRTTRAKFMVLNAVHSKSSPVAPPHQGTRNISDAAHCTFTLFHAVHCELARMYPLAAFVQVHGMGNGKEDVRDMYLTNQFDGQYTRKHISLPILIAQSLPEFFDLPFCNTLMLCTKTLPGEHQGIPYVAKGGFVPGRSWFRTNTEGMMNTCVQGRHLNGGSQGSLGKEDKGRFCHMELAYKFRNKTSVANLQKLGGSLNLALQRWQTGPTTQPAFVAYAPTELPPLSQRPAPPTPAPAPTPAVRIPAPVPPPVAVPARKSRSVQPVDTTAAPSEDCGECLYEFEDEAAGLREQSQRVADIGY